MNRLTYGSFLVLFYRQVKNGSEISLDPNYGTVIDLKYIGTLFTLLSSLKKVIKKIEQEEKITSLQYEIVSYFCPSKNGREVTKLSQIHRSCESCDIAVVLHSSVGDQLDTILSRIQGEETNSEILEETLTDEKRQFLATYLKLTQAELNISTFEDCIAMKLAVKDYC
jgi:hypothetical protein